MINRYTAADNRKAAATAGALTFTGTPCRAAGHDGTRYTSTGACVECMGARYQRQRAARKGERVDDSALALIN